MSTLICFRLWFPAGFFVYLDFFFGPLPMMLGITGCGLDGPITVHHMIVGGLDGLFMAKQPVPFVTMPWFLLVCHFVGLLFCFVFNFCTSSFALLVVICSIPFMIL